MSWGSFIQSLDSWIETQEFLSEYWSLKLYHNIHEFTEVFGSFDHDYWRAESGSLLSHGVGVWRVGVEEGVTAEQGDDVI